MSTDQICAYCEHHAAWHMDGKGPCGGSGCPCPRFIANTDTETHEVTEQVIKEAEQRQKSVLGLAVESERIVGCMPKGTMLSVGGTHLPTDIIPPPPAIPSERKQSRATKLSILVFDCVDQAIQAARAGRVEDAEEWRDLAKQVDEL